MATIIIGLVVGTAIFGAVYKIRADKKSGKCSCGGKCSGCPNGSIEHLLHNFLVKTMAEIIAESREMRRLFGQ